jgi:DNA-binding beta-propeller fold protein YncE
MAQQVTLVAVQQQRDSVVVFNPASNTKLAQAKVGFKPHEVTYDPITKKCFISNFGLEDYDLKVGKTGNTISVFDPLTGKVIKQLYTSKDTSVHNGPHGVKARPGKYRELFVNTEIGGDSLVVYSTKDYTIKRKFALPVGTHNLSFSASGDTLWLMSGKSGAYSINPVNGAILQHVILPSPIRGLLVAKQWLVASCKNEVFLLSKNNLTVLKHFGNLGLKDGLILYSNITEDQRYILAPAANDSILLVIDTSTGKVVHRLETGSTPLNVQVNSMKAYVTHAKDDYITTIDLENFTITKAMKAFGTNGLVLIR